MILGNSDCLEPLPHAAKVQVPTPLADALLHAAESLPEYDNQEFYSTDLQSFVHDRIRQASRSDFDWLVGEIRSRIARRPYCALVQGIRYDEGNRLFVGINRAFGELVARPYEKPRRNLCITFNQRLICPLLMAANLRPKNCIQILPTGTLPLS